MPDRKYSRCFFNVLLILFTLISINSFAYEYRKNQVSAVDIDNNLTLLASLIAIADKKKLDTTREKMTIRTAEVFLKWAQWDEDNIVTNMSYYKEHKLYKKNARNHAKQLPIFEHNSVNALLIESITELKKVIDGKVNRLPVPKVNYENVYIKNGVFTIDDNPVFIADYTWKPNDEALTEYYGNLNSAYIAPSFIESEKGHYNKNKYKKIKRNKREQIGQTFVSHKSIPSWITKAYPDFTDTTRYYSAYDIDHPAAKPLFHQLFKRFVPILKDSRSTDLGYMLYNEPSFFTEKDTWNTGGVSKYTHRKFKSWLSKQHTSIEKLNQRWGTSFSDFSDIQIEIPMEAKLRGTAVWYDWMRFNQIRVTNWFAFLKQSINSFDPEGMTHIKLMPWLWTEEKRDHGMDFEALLAMNDIIDFDAQSRYSHIRGKIMPWTDKYSFDWISPMMMFDFAKSVQPEQVIWDSENHFFNNVTFKEKDIDINYLKSIYWLAATHGFSGTSTWVWGRNQDGSIIKREKGGSEYITDVTHQPKGLHAITRTFMELNAHAKDVVALQNIPKQLRLFYSETAAINNKDYIYAINDVYQSLYFEGVALGFASENIINTLDNKQWQAVVVKAAKKVKLSELNALQAYLDNGGTIFIDSQSLQLNEYGEIHTPKLQANNKQLITFTDLTDLQNKTNSFIEERGFSPLLTLDELNKGQYKKVAWRSVKTQEGRIVSSLINVGTQAVTFRLAVDDVEKIAITDLLTGQNSSHEITLQPRSKKFIAIAY